MNRSEKHDPTLLPIRERIARAAEAWERIAGRCPPPSGLMEVDYFHGVPTEEAWSRGGPRYQKLLDYLEAVEPQPSLFATVAEWWRRRRSGFQGHWRSGIGLG